MITNSQAAARRPQPPAKLKRMSSNIKSTPPPPYAASTPSTASRSPSLRLSMPPRINGWDGLRHGTSPASPAAEDWLSEHSRLDLSKLLSKADELIKDRENDIGVTSAACKSLHENSVVLKSKHEAFLRKIPFSPMHSPSVSLTPSPANSTTPLPQTPHYYSASISGSPTNYNASILSPPIRRQRHTRKISVSQNDIALLSDQNAELMSKLEALETDCAQAEHAARRKLQRLEKEIQGLREELEVTQVKNEELEEKAKAGMGKVEEAWKKKLEREEKFRALRGKFDAGTGSSEVKDFAPGSNSIQSADSTPVKRVHKTASSSRIFRPAFDFPPKTIRRLDNDDHDVFSPSYSRCSVSASQHELAVVSQLLMKIQELQEANEEITEQQAKTASTLHSVHKDAESIRRVYECLGDNEGFEWEIVVDEGQEKAKDEKRPVEDKTIRFQSFRRSLQIDLPTDEDYFSSGIGGNMQSTVNEAALNRIVSNHKMRKSVVGLFDGPRASEQSPSTILGPQAPFPIDTDSVRISTNALSSPALSILSIAVPSPTDEKRPTLGSELGSEFGDDWSGNTGNHHLRNTSLYQLTIPSTPPSPGPTSRPIQVSGTSTNTSHEPTSLQVSPPHARSSLQPQPKVADRYRRMSQTIRSRTNQWLDGRLKETLPSSTGFSGKPLEDDIRTGFQSSLAPVPQKLALATMFDSVVGTFTRSGEQEPGTSEPDNDEDAPTQGTVVKVHNKEQKSQGVVLELWLWLQFAIIILVFLWAMAKRGPKSVLGEVDKRKAVSAKFS